MTSRYKVHLRNFYYSWEISEWDAEVISLKQDRGATNYLYYTDEYYRYPTFTYTRTSWNENLSWLTPEVNEMRAFDFLLPSGFYTSSLFHQVFQKSQRRTSFAFIRFNLYTGGERVSRKSLHFLKTGKCFPRTSRELTKLLACFTLTPRVHESFPRSSLIFQRWRIPKIIFIYRIIRKKTDSIYTCSWEHSFFHGPETNLRILTCNENKIMY